METKKTSTFTLLSNCLFSVRYLNELFKTGFILTLKSITYWTVVSKDTGKVRIQAILDQLEFVCGNTDLGNVLVSFFIVFNDVSDCIHHDILSKKIDFHWIRGIPNTWFQSYLSDLKQYVSVNNTSSILPFISWCFARVNLGSPFISYLY